jgi:hypothetical protein
MRCTSAADGRLRAVEILPPDIGIDPTMIDATGNPRFDKRSARRRLTGNASLLQSRVLKRRATNLSPRQSRATGSIAGGWHLVEEVNGDWCEVDAPALNNALWSRLILDVTIHDKQALNATYPAEILDESLSELSCKS